MKEKKFWSLSWTPDLLIEVTAPIIKWFLFPDGRRTASPDLSELIYQNYFEN